MLGREFHLYISNTDSFQPFLSWTFLRWTVQSHQKPCFFKWCSEWGTFLARRNKLEYPAPGVCHVPFEAIYLPHHTQTNLAELFQGMRRNLVFNDWIMVGIKNIQGSFKAIKLEGQSHATNGSRARTVCINILISSANFKSVLDTINSDSKI